MANGSGIERIFPNSPQVFRKGRVCFLPLVRRSCSRDFEDSGADFEFQSQDHTLNKEGLMHQQGFTWGWIRQLPLVFVA